jgi:hypothetical protein
MVIKLKTIICWYTVLRYFVPSAYRTHFVCELMKTRPERGLQQMAQYVYSILCERGRSYTGETGRLLGVQLREHRHNFKEGRLGKSKLAQHAHEVGLRVIWDDS